MLSFFGAVAFIRRPLALGHAFLRLSFPSISPPPFYLFHFHFFSLSLTLLAYLFAIYIILFRIRFRHFAPPTERTQRHKTFRLHCLGPPLPPPILPTIPFLFPIFQFLSLLSGGTENRKWQRWVGEEGRTDY